MRVHQDYWQNASSGYRASKKVSELVEEARAEVASLIDARPEEVYFTSGGTESNNTVIASADALLGSEAKIATSQIEHSAVLRPIERLETAGRTVHYVPVNAGGVIELDALRSCQPQFVSMMWANNETGVIQPIKEVSEWAREGGIPFHTDAVQAVGKIAVSVQECPVSFLSMSAHKFHGPKGVGALYVKEGMRMQPAMLGGGQEGGMRSGTEDVASIVGMGVAAKTAAAQLSSKEQQIRERRDLFEQLVLEKVTGVSKNGELHHRLSTHSHLSFQDCEAAGLLILLDEYGVQCSAGSACMTGKQQASHVQVAMGIPEERAKSSLRFSLSHTTSKEDVSYAAEQVARAVKKLRSVQTTGIGPVTVYTP